MALKVQIDFSQWIKFNKKLRDKLIEDWLEQALEAYALTLEELIVEEIERRKLEVSGEMKKSITHKVTQKLNKYLVEVGTNLKTSSGYPYPVGVHEGTIAHVAPYSAIEKWVKLKMGKQGKELKRTAGAVWQKIKQRGTEAHPFMQTVFTKYKSSIRAEIGKELLIAMKKGAKLV